MRFSAMSARRRTLLATSAVGALLLSTGVFRAQADQNASTTINYNCSAGGQSLAFPLGVTAQAAPGTPSAGGLIDYIMTFTVKPGSMPASVSGAPLASYTGMQIKLTTPAFTSFEDLFDTTPGNLMVTTPPIGSDGTVVAYADGPITKNQADLTVGFTMQVAVDPSAYENSIELLKPEVTFTAHLDLSEVGGPSDKATATTCATVDPEVLVGQMTSAKGATTTQPSTQTTQASSSSTSMASTTSTTSAGSTTTTVATSQGSLASSSTTSTTSTTVTTLAVGTITGRVFHDVNGNGERDRGELDITGVGVTLRDAQSGELVAHTQTHSPFVFSDVPVGSYNLTLDNTDDFSSRAATVKVTIEEHGQTVDVGDLPGLTRMAPLPPRPSTTFMGNGEANRTTTTVATTTSRATTTSLPTAPPAFTGIRLMKGLGGGLALALMGLGMAMLSLRPGRRASGF